MHQHDGSSRANSSHGVPGSQHVRGQLFGAEQGKAGRQALAQDRRHDVQLQFIHQLPTEQQSGQLQAAPDHTSPGSPKKLSNTPQR